MVFLLFLRLSFWSMGRVPYFKTTFERLYFSTSKSWVTEFRSCKATTALISPQLHNRPPCCFPHEYYFSEVRSRIGAGLYHVTSFWNVETTANLSCRERFCFSREFVALSRIGLYFAATVVGHRKNKTHIISGTWSNHRRRMTWHMTARLSCFCR